MNLVSPKDFQLMKESQGVNLTELRDEVAKIAFKELLVVDKVMEHVCNGNDPADMTKIVSTLVWDFADAFMRERYERECVFRAMLEPNFGNKSE